MTACHGPRACELLWATKPKILPQIEATAQIEAAANRQPALPAEGHLTFFGAGYTCRVPLRVSARSRFRSVSTNIVRPTASYRPNIKGGCDDLGNSDPSVSANSCGDKPDRAGGGFDRAYRLADRQLFARLDCAVSRDAHPDQ